MPVGNQKVFSALFVVGEKKNNPHHIRHLLTFWKQCLVVRMKRLEIVTRRLREVIIPLYSALTLLFVETRSSFGLISKRKP